MICKKCGVVREEKKVCKVCVKKRNAIKYKKSKLDDSTMGLSQLSVKWVTGG